MPVTRDTGLRGSNVVRVGSYNQAVVLDAIRRATTISRVEIAQLTGLSPQTVTNISRRLLAEGVIEETGKIATAVGKPRTGLGLRPRGLIAAGIQFDPSASTIVVLDLAGDLLHRADFLPPPSADPGEVIAHMGREVDRALSQVGVDADRVLGVGIGTPGPVDLIHGTVQEPPNLPRWAGVPLRDQLRDVIGLPVVIDKDTVAAAVADSWNATAGARATAVIYIGTGIGVGCHIEGAIVRGASGNAGEIGHIVVDPGGPPCPCGAHGCVAVTCAPSALAARFAPDIDSIPAALTDIQRRMTTHADLRAAVELAAQGVERLARVVARLYDVDRLVFGGPMWPFYSHVLDGTRLDRLGASLSVETVHDITATGSPQAADLGAVGAACLVFDTLVSPRATRLLMPTRAGA